MNESVFYVIAYDISDTKRRTKVHNLLSGYCAWTQYSLFEGYLSPKQYIALEAKLCKIIDKEHDSVRFYPLCQADVKKVVTYGSPAPQKEREYIV